MVSVRVGWLSDPLHCIIIHRRWTVPCLIWKQSHGASCGGLVRRFRIPVQSAAVRDT